MTPSRTDKSLLTVVLLNVILIFAASVSNAEELIARGSTWLYMDDGSDLGTAWRTPSGQRLSPSQTPAADSSGANSTRKWASVMPSRGGRAVVNRTMMGCV